MWIMDRWKIGARQKGAYWKNSNVEAPGGVGKYNREEDRVDLTYQLTGWPRLERIRRGVVTTGS